MKTSLLNCTYEYAGNLYAIVYNITNIESKKVLLLIIPNTKNIIRDNLAN